MKLLCNVCYAQELTVHDYHGVLYVDACPCISKDHDFEVKMANESGYMRGHQYGYEDGFDDGFKRGKNNKGEED